MQQLLQSTFMVNDSKISLIIYSSHSLVASGARQAGAGGLGSARPTR